MPKGGYKHKVGAKPRSRFTGHVELHPETTRPYKLDNPAFVKGRTMFRSRLRKAVVGGGVLKSGHNQRKLGDRVSKGAWAGSFIYALTLEERATCPRTCHMWNNCYGNSMHLSKRFRHGASLEDAIEYDLARLEERHPRGFVVRLHILGDFYSTVYVGWWRHWLEEFTGLRVFGYTARDPGTKIGHAIQNLNRDFGNRFVVRFSSLRPGPMRATVIKRLPEAAVVPEGIVCPAQTGKTANCGSCGLCWAEAAKDKCIVFVRHGNPGRKGTRNGEGKRRAGGAPGNP